MGGTGSRRSPQAGRVLERELVVFDTETTGLDGGAEIVETSCVNRRGEVLLDTLVRPAGPIPAASSLKTRGSAHSPGH